MALEIITDVNYVDRSQWEEFVCNHPDGNIFQMPCMFDLYQLTKRRKPSPFFVFDGEELVGLLIAVQLKNVFPPLTFFTRRQIIFGGPLIKNNDSAILLALLDALFRKTARSVVFTEVRNYRLGLSLKPVYEEAGFYYKSYLSVSVDMNRKAGELWASLSPIRKESIEKLRLVNHVIKELTDGEEYQMAWKMLRKSFLAKGRFMPPYSLMKVLQSSKILTPHIRASVLYVNNSIKAAVWFLILGDRAQLWLDAHVLDEKEQWMFDGFLWKCMLKLKNDGIRHLELGSGGKPGQDIALRQYKKSYGGMIHESGRFFYVHNWFLWNLGRLLYYWYKNLRIFVFTNIIKR